MNLLHRFQAFIRKENLFTPADKLLLAVSGGVDSVVLCELCRLAGFHFVMAHCNFGLRGEESERDEAFVCQLGEKYGKQVLVKKFDAEKYAVNERVSVQVAARELRYSWFRELTAAGERATGHTQAAYIVTAHHADDNIETVLMNFFKGTGIAGMRGILPRQQNLIRPLLFARKADLLEFATQQQLAYVEDSSNATDKYSRNYFRHQLIPGVQKVFPQAEENLIGNINRFREAEMLYRQAVSHHKSKLLEKKGEETHIPVLKWKKAVPLETVTFEIIRDFGFTPHQTGEVIALMDSSTGSYVQSGSFRIIRHRQWMIISPVNSSEPAMVVIGEQDEKISFAGGALSFKRIPAEAGVTASTRVAELDAALVQFPLVLRKFKQGDYFYPLGMQKKKKLGRFLSDLKTPLPEKENTWVLEMDRKILWVVGKRIDDRYKVSAGTRTILQMTIESSQSGAYE